VFAVFMCGSTVSAASRLPLSSRPAQTIPRPWHLIRARPADPRRVRVAITSGYCSGEPKPHIDHTKLVEGPATRKEPGGSAIITVYVHFPERPDTEALCADESLELEARVQLRRPAATLYLFDGSSSPPRLVVRPDGHSAK
jgi:hypothetical protein